MATFGNRYNPYELSNYNSDSVYPSQYGIDKIVVTTAYGGLDNFCRMASIQSPSSEIIQLKRQLAEKDNTAQKYLDKERVKGIVSYFYSRKN